MYCLLINYRPKQLLFFNYLSWIIIKLCFESILNDFLKKFITKFFTSFIIYYKF
jgi:hypothetical protein